MASLRTINPRKEEIMAKEKETHIIVDPEAKSLREKFQQMLQAYQELEKQPPG